MIRLVIVDDHPALRAGLSAVLRAEPGLVPLGVASDAAELEPLLARTRPDLVLLDYHLPGEDGLRVCRRLKRTVPAPAVLLYSAYADGSLAIPAVLAGADGLVHKGAPAQELYEAIRCVARGDKVLPPVGAEHRQQAASALDEQDMPILGMLLEGTPPAEAASTLRLDGRGFSERVDRMIDRLRVEIPAA
ncbi:MAG TPA: response regulator transcription factor [Solirubrobacteraceae bacterium]|nr:response regulator transcription factor [Solirubrobacteraceae bacterium]